MTKLPSKEQLADLRKLEETATAGPYVIYPKSKSHSDWYRIGSETSKHAFPFENILFVVQNDDTRVQALNADFVHKAMNLCKPMLDLIAQQEEQLQKSNSLLDMHRSKWEVVGGEFCTTDKKKMSDMIALQARQIEVLKEALYFYSSPMVGFNKITGEDLEFESVIPHVIADPNNSPSLMKSHPLGFCAKEALKLVEEIEK